MESATMIIDKDYVSGEIDPRLFGSFIEHMGRAVYSGIYEPGHPNADEQGFRKDVLELVQKLGVSVVRYPGGNFVSGYNWIDGIGKQSDRPKRLDFAWKSIESNQIGIDEFVDWCSKANTTLIETVNLGTGTPADAGNIVEYSNYPSGTYWSDLRIKNGHKHPHAIKTWCLGNEMDGEWQTGHLCADDYSKKAVEAAKIMKWVDPSIKLILCGSAPEWDREVLEYAYDSVDYISIHNYHALRDTEHINDFFASFLLVEDFIHTTISTLDYAKAKRRSKKVVDIAFDEWNICDFRRLIRKDWETAPHILEDYYTMMDALVFGGLLCAIVKNAHRVKIACQALLVNVVAPILTQAGGPAIRQSIYFPFQQVSVFGKGKVLNTIMNCTMFDSAVAGDAPVLQTLTTYDEENKSLCLFVTNFNQQSDIQLSLDLRSFGTIVPIEHTVMRNADLYALNSFESPDEISPRDVKLPSFDGGKVAFILPSLSWNMIRFMIQ